MEQQIDPNQLVSLVEQRKWVPLAAVVIWLTIRLLKSDTKLPTIPPRVRIWVVFALGIASAVLDHVTQGETWTRALIGAGISVLFALAFHEGAIESLRAGRDIAIPWLIKPGASPSPTAPPTLPSPPPVDQQ